MIDYLEGRVFIVYISNRATCMIDFSSLCSKTRLQQGAQLEESKELNRR